ncbi:MAG: thioredoxin family protein [Micromonosporaceae bacterium]
MERALRAGVSIPRAADPSREFPDVRNAAGRPRLEVYVSSHCRTCGEAQRLAQEAATRFPSVDVRVIDLDGGGPVPEVVVAIPTYVMDGGVVWLGNPAPEELFARLHEAVA